MKTQTVLGLATLSVVLSLPLNAQATEVGNQRTFGLGFALGNPNSLVGKVFVGAGRAIDFGIGWSGYGSGYGSGRCWNGRNYDYCDRGGYHQTGINADYLWQENLVFDRVTLDWHIGAGARMWFLNSDRFVNGGNGTVAVAARMPVGVDLTFTRPSFLEVYAELAPSIYIVPGATFDVEGALGVRLYF